MPDKIKGGCDIMKSNFYETPIVAGPNSNIVLSKDCKAVNKIKTGVIVGVVVVGVVVSVVTVPESMVVVPIVVAITL